MRKQPVNWLQPFCNLAEEIGAKEEKHIMAEFTGIFNDFNQHLDEGNLQSALLDLEKLVDFEILNQEMCKAFLADVRETTCRNQSEFRDIMEDFEKEKRWDFLRQLWMIYRVELNDCRAESSETPNFEEISLSQAAYCLAKNPTDTNLAKGVWTQKERLSQEALELGRKLLTEDALGAEVEQVRTNLNLEGGLYLNPEPYTPETLQKISQIMRNLGVVASVASVHLKGSDPWFREHPVVAFLRKERLKQWRGRAQGGGDQNEGLSQILADQICMNS